MKPGDPLPIDISKLASGTFVGCVITSPAVSPLIEAARTPGCPTSTGTDMYNALQSSMLDFLLADGGSQRTAMFTTVDAISEGASYDLVVIGSGVAGMSAALFAAIEGRKVLVVERTEYVGGTSALSAATTWMPNSHHSSSVNPDDSREKVRQFLDAVVGNHSPAAMREAFLDSAPEAVATLEANSEVKFRPYATHPDYEQQFEGATMRGRALEPVPFDGRAARR